MLNLSVNEVVILTDLIPAPNFFIANGFRNSSGLSKWFLSATCVLVFYIIWKGVKIQFSYKNVIAL